MVADIFTALAEDRPYRKGMSEKEVKRVLNLFRDRRLLDPVIIELLIENYDEIHSEVLQTQAIAKQYYENQFTALDDNTAHVKA